MTGGVATSGAERGVAMDENPFKFSGVVEKPAFCDREKEQKELGRYIGNSQNVLLYSHRRYGKSSLILQIFKDVKGVKSIYVDLYGTTRVEEFVTALLRGISSVESQMNRLIKIMQEGIRSIGINFGIDPVTGSPTASPVFNKVAEDKTIDEVFAVLENLSQKAKMVVAFDEFQEVATYGGAAFEKRLRKSIQRHDNISYIFAGSQKHLITEMFKDRNRAFYKLATSYPLGRIETVHYVNWVKHLYQRANRQIDGKLIEDVVQRCENHPMYVQEFFFNVWMQERLSFGLLDKIEREIVGKRILEYANIWDSLTLNQKRALKLLAGTGGENIYAAENLGKYGFRTASQVSAALSKLEEDGIIDKNQKWKVHDPFFRKWLS